MVGVVCWRLTVVLSHEDVGSIVNLLNMFRDFDVSGPVTARCDKLSDKVRLFSGFLL